MDVPAKLIAVLMVVIPNCIAGVLLFRWRSKVVRETEDKKCLRMLRDVAKERLPLLRQELLKPKGGRVSLFGAREDKLARLRKDMLDLAPKLSKDHIGIRRAVEGYPKSPADDMVAFHEQLIEDIDRILGPDE